VRLVEAQDRSVGLAVHLGSCIQRTGPLSAAGRRPDLVNPESRSTEASRAGPIDLVNRDDCPMADQLPARQVQRKISSKLGLAVIAAWASGGIAAVALLSCSPISSLVFLRFTTECAGPRLKQRLTRTFTVGLTGFEPATP